MYILLLTIIDPLCVSGAYMGTKVAFLRKIVKALRGDYCSKLKFSKIFNVKFL